MPSPNKIVVGVLGFGLTVTGLALAASPAAAVTGVFISEFHYDNDGTDTGEFVEVTAPAGTDLSGYQVVLYNGGGTPAGASYDVDDLSGVIADQQDGWGTAVIDYPSNGIQNGSPDGIALVNGGTVVDFLSYEGVLTASNGPASGQVSTDVGVAEISSTPVGDSLQRQEDGSWAGSAANSKGVPNGHTVDGDPGVLTAVSPGDRTGTVGEPIAAFTMTATGGTTPYTWSATGLPDGVTIDATTGEVAGTPTTACSCSATVTVTDDAAATDDVALGFTVADPVSVTPIAEVQGSGPASPFDDQDVLVEGVVTGVYADPYDAEPGMANYGGLDGFYLQTAGTGGAVDTTPGASDAVFVYTGNDVPSGLSVGDSVEVAGTVDEFNTMTEIVSPTVTELEAPLAAITPLAIAYPTTEADREAQEGMLLQPTGSFTVTNSFATNQFGEVGLATGSEPLLQPSDVARPGTAAYDAVLADNAARGVVLDDGTSINYLTNGSAQQDYPLPWLTPTNAVRVGAAATLEQGVVLEYRFNTWRFQPTEAVLDAGNDVATFEDTRAANAAPQDVGGDLKLATFNVLNYFNTTGEQFVANGGSCTFYTDRDNNPIANNTCTPDGPRGAANDASFQRQQAKIVTAINGLGADVVSLEELENSIKLLTETDRDDAIAALVGALNADAGAGTWAFVDSPAEALEPANVAEQDVIRNGFIYRTATVEPVGESDMLFGSAEFANAREPLAQVFRPAGGSTGSEFAAVVNHFKSKGCSGASGDNADAGDGQSCYNGDRVRQAQALVDFVEGFLADREVERVFLTGDFNSYSQEDPMHVLDDAGFSVLQSDSEGDYSYSFSGLSGSLDHVLANDAALADVTGADVWEINANESVAYQYSRFNYNVTDLHTPDQFAASDHNPEVVGVDVAPSFTDAQVSINGSARFGRVLTAEVDSWTPSPDEFAYQWFADGVAIDGATRSWLRLNRASYVGKRVTVEVTGTLAGYDPLTVTSAPTAPVTKGRGHPRR
jgi:predicted extracellular nuclease